MNPTCEIAIEDVTLAPFVSENSIVRKIWGEGDNVLVIFAGAAAEFALNKAVDWLYFTGKLPADPLARLFSTVAYAHKIIFSPYQQAVAAIDQITAIHEHVEAARGSRIPDWAYRDVLFMLIDYTIRSYELLKRKLSTEEKREIFQVFLQVGNRMGIGGLPQTYHKWQQVRAEHLQQNLHHSNFTADLFKQYRKHLGPIRYWLMTKVQTLVSPMVVTGMLGFNRSALFYPALWGYKALTSIGMNRVFRDALLPADYKAQIMALDRDA